MIQAGLLPSCELLPLGEAWLQLQDLTGPLSLLHQLRNWDEAVLNSHAWCRQSLVYKSSRMTWLVGPLHMIRVLMGSCPARSRCSG